jgi:hypothetical protein
MVVEVGLRMVLVRVEGDRSAEGIGQRSAAVGVWDYDNGGSGMPCPFIAAAVDTDRHAGRGVSRFDDAVGAGHERDAQRVDRTHCCDRRMAGEMNGVAGGSA